METQLKTLAKQQNPQVLDASLNFYPIWPEYIRERTAFTVGWSYIVCWVGLGLTLVARDHSHTTSQTFSCFFTPNPVCKVTQPPFPIT